MGYNHELVIRLQHWATWQIERGLERVAFFRGKSTANYREQAANNWQQHADVFAQCLEVLEGYENMGNYLHKGDSKEALAFLVASWQELDEENLRMLFEDALRIRREQAVGRHSPDS